MASPIDSTTIVVEQATDLEHVDRLDLRRGAGCSCCADTVLIGPIAAEQQAMPPAGRSVVCARSASGDPVSIPTHLAELGVMSVFDTGS